MQVIPPICVYCKHYSRDEKSTALTCAAFPNGIPVAILHSIHDHRTPYAGDNGIVFELDSPKNANALELLLNLHSSA